MDLQQFEKLFRDLFPQLSAYAFKLVGDFDSAKEIVHKVFVNTWEKREDIRTDQNVKSYLYTSVYNRCLNHIRDRKKDVQLDEMHENVLEEAPENSLEVNELQARIDAAISSLPDRCQQVFRLSRFEELKYSEIADKLEISVKTVEVQMSKALKILREQLADFLTVLIIFLLNR